MISTICGIVILFMIFIIPKSVKVFKSISFKDPTTLFIMALTITSLLIIVHFLKKSEKNRKTGELIEWFSLLFTPVPIGIEAIIRSGISLYWIYFVYVIPSVFWIAIGVYNGGHNPRNWDENYQNFFIIGCIIIIAFGILIYVNFDILYDVIPSRFFPWLSPDQNSVLIQKHQ